MKVFSYIWEHKFLALLIIILLVAQIALQYIDPYWQSKIINVGLAQNGIEHISPDKMAKETYNNICAVDSNCTELLENSYSKIEYENYGIKELNKEQRDQLDNDIEKPFAYVFKCKLDNIEISKTGYDEFLNTNSNGTIKSIAYYASKDESSKFGINTFRFQVRYISNQSMIMLMFILLYCIATYLISISTTKIALNIGYDKKSKIFKKIVNFSNEQVSKFGQISLLTRITNDIVNIESFVAMIFIVLISAPINIVIGLTFSFISAPMMAWIVVLAALAIFVASIISVKIFAPIFRKIQVRIENSNIILHEILSGIFTIKAFNNKKFETDRFDKANNSLYAIQQFIGKVNAFVFPMLTLGANFITVIVLFFGGINISNGAIQVGDIVAFSSYAALVISAFSSLGLFIGTLPKALVSVKRVEEIINEDCSSDIKKADSNNKIKFKNSLKCTNINFTYNYKDYALKNINLEIKKGQTVGIVGEIGSGKSTLLKALMNFYNLESGEITIDGQDVNNISDNEYRDLFAYAPQDAFLFSGTIKDNILYGIDKPEKIDETKLAEILEDVCLDKYKDSTKDILETEISQDSINISGGQKQRISIARAFASDRQIMLFDDTFSSLDYQIEGKIIKNLYKNYQDKTKIIVASRLTSVRNADKIITMDNGEIVGIGTYEELCKTCEQFIKIARSQKTNL